jgi:predicted dehydrogenase
MLKIGLAGLGHLGKIHLQQLRLLPQVAIVGIHDIDAQLLQEQAQLHQLPAFNEYEGLVEAADAIVIVTPTPTHFELAKKAIQSTKHVFIEKPVTDHPEHARSLVKLVEEARVVVQVGHVERFNPAFTALQGFQLNPMFIESHRLAPWNPRGTDVSVVFDLMIHDIDIVLHIVRSGVHRIYASGTAVVSRSADIANARIEFNNGCVANLTASRISMAKMRKMRIFQQDAYISIDFLNKKSEVLTIQDGPNEATGSSVPLLVEGQTKYIQTQQLEVNDQNAIYEELKSFVNAATNNLNPTVSLLDASASIEVAHEISQKITNIS